MALTVRSLTLADDPEAFGRIVVSSYHALPGHPVDPDYEDELLDVAARVRTATVLGALDGTAPLGCVTYVDGAGSFRMLAVSPAAQGRGVGEALVRACLDRARGAGRSAVFIYSGSWMGGAHRLYRRLGFVPAPERDWEIASLFTLLGFRVAL